jgi:hypothetical protein
LPHLSLGQGCVARLFYFSFFIFPTPFGTK